MTDATVTVQVLYTCELCGIKDRPVTVAARGSEDVVDWLHGKCAVAISNDHLMTSPSCRATKMTNLKVPLTGADKIGGVIKQ